MIPSPICRLIAPTGDISLHHPTAGVVDSGIIRTVFATLWLRATFLTFSVDIIRLSENIFTFL
jgi:hypothetical protein